MTSETHGLRQARQDRLRVQGDSRDSNSFEPESRWREGSNGPSRTGGPGAHGGYTRQTHAKNDTDRALMVRHGIGTPGGGGTIARDDRSPEVCGQRHVIGKRPRRVADPGGRVGSRGPGAGVRVHRW
ncbi:hypothetical protein GCM10018952_72250 [Streptosporangium vulgare]